jgi:hypothetical protein
LSSAILNVLTHRDKAAAMGRAAVEFTRARNHPDDVAKRTLDAYRSILGGTGS